MKAGRSLIVAVSLLLATAGILLAALSSPLSAIGQSKLVIVGQHSSQEEDGNPLG
jgi:hypothetical protein